MKKNFLKIIGGTISMFLIIATLSFGLVFAQNDSSSRGGGRLEGTWDARVTIRDCQTGGEIRSFDSIGSFMQGGTMIDSTSGVPQALKTPGHGVWSHLTGHSYKFSFKSFSFDAAGNYTGYTIIRHTATLNPGATAYTSAGTAEVYAPNGVLVFTGCSSTTATRFE